MANSNDERERVCITLDYYDDDDDTGQESEGIQQARRAAKANAKRVKELEQELNSLRSDLRQRSVSDVVSARGLNPRISELIPSGITSRDDINAWLDERAELFGLTSESAAGLSSPQQPVPPAGAARLADVVSAGEPIPGDESQLLAQIRAARTPAELNRLIFGSEMGPPAF